MTRTVSLTKPHLYKSSRGYWCCFKTGTRIGAAWTPAAAYKNWAMLAGLDA